MSNTIDEIGDIATLDGLVNHTLEEFEDDNITEIRTNAFSNNEVITKISLPSLTKTNGYPFYYCSKLKNVNLGNIKEIKSYSFSHCQELDTVTATAQYINSSAFYVCYLLTNIDCQNVTKIDSYAFRDSGIGKLILPKIKTLSAHLIQNSCVSTIDIGETYNNSLLNQFTNSGFLCHIIVRSNSLIKFSSSFSTQNAGAFSRGIGWIYVPSDLVDEYKSATNWSNYANQIVSIDEYPKPLQNETISDSWDDIITSVNNGTYSSKYNIGDIKCCDIGGMCVPMQIVAFNVDTLEDGTTAPITFISLCSIKVMNYNDDDSFTDWSDCDLRKRLRNIIYPQIESTVRSAIKPVTKINTLSSSIDNIWIPSLKEVKGLASETGTYYDIFDNGAKKGFCIDGATNYTDYFLRTTDNSKRPYIINSGNGYDTTSPINYKHVVIGFCI